MPPPSVKRQSRSRSRSSGGGSAPLPGGQSRSRSSGGVSGPLSGGQPRSSKSGGVIGNGLSGDIIPEVAEAETSAPAGSHSSQRGQGSLNGSATATAAIDAGQRSGTASAVGSRQSREFAAAGSITFGSGSTGYDGCSQPCSGGTPHTLHTASLPSPSFHTAQAGSGQFGSVSQGSVGTNMGGAPLQGSAQHGSSQRSGGTPYSCQQGSGPTGGSAEQQASVGASEPSVPSDASSAAQLVPLHAVVDAIAPGTGFTCVWLLS